MEFFCTRIQVSEELLRILCLFIVLLLFADNVTELIGTNLAHAFVVSFILYALVVVSVSTHKVNRWKAQKLLTAITVFRVKVFSLGLQVFNLRSHILDLSHIFFNLLVILPSDSVLHFKSVDQVVFDHTEL